MPGVLAVYKKYLRILTLEVIPLLSYRDIKNLSGHIADKDVPVLASAIMSNSDFLVTGR